MTAQASATAAGAASSAASASSTAAAAASAEAEACAVECEGKVGKERGAPCRKEADAAKAAAAAAATAQAATAASAKACSEASASASASANVTANQQGVTATQASADAAARAKTDAEAPAAATAKAEADAKAALERCKAAKDKCIADAEKEKTDASAKSKAIIDKMKADLAKANSGGVAAIVGGIMLVPGLKKSLAEQQAIVQEAKPNRGTIGEAQRTELEAQEDEGQKLLQQASELMTQKARKLADDAKAKADGSKTQYDKAVGEADKATQEAGKVDGDYDKAVGEGGTFVKDIIDAKRQLVKAGIAEVSQHNQQAGTAVTEMLSGVQTLTSAISQAVTGFLDVATSDKTHSAADVVAAGAAAITGAVPKVLSAVTDFSQARDAAVQGAKDEATKIKTGATNAAATVVSDAAKSVGLTGSQAVAMLDAARQGPTMLLSVINPLLGMAAQFGGSLFTDALGEATKQKEAGEKAHGDIIKNIEKTKSDFQTQHQTKADELKTHADQVEQEATTAVSAVKTKAETETDGEKQFPSLLEEIGKFATDLVKPKVDELKTVRTGLGTEAGAMDTIIGGLKEVTGGLGERVKSLVEQIMPDFGDDPVTPKATEVTTKKTELETKAKDIDTKHTGVMDAITGAKNKAQEWLKSMTAKSDSFLEEIKAISGKANGGVEGLQDNMISDIDAKIKSLGDTETEAGTVGGTIGEALKKILEEAKKAAEEEKKKTEENIKKGAALLRAEIDAWNKQTLKTGELFRETETAVETANTEADTVAKTTADSYGKLGKAEIDAGLQRGGAAKEEVAKIKTDLVAMRDAITAMEAEVGAIEGDLDRAGKLADCKDKIAGFLVDVDKIDAKFPAHKKSAEEALKAVKDAAAKAKTDFAAKEKTVTAAAAAQEKEVAAMLEKARKGDEKAINTLQGNAADQIADAEARVKELDDQGGSEASRVRVQVAKSSTRVKEMFAEAAKLEPKK